MMDEKKLLEELKLIEEFRQSLNFLKYKYKRDRNKLAKIKLIEKRFKRDDITIEEIKRYKKAGEDNKMLLK